MCPFSDQPNDEDTLAREAFSDIPGIQHRPECGYHHDSVLGYSGVSGHRDGGASGGLTTWVLESLLAEGRIDAAVCVTPDSAGGRWFQFAVARTAGEIRAGARSCYAPVEWSEALRRILSQEGQYAITALPCYAKALRRAMKSLPLLRRRVRFVLGLVCGQYKSRFFTEYLCAFGGGDPNHIDEVAYRIKDPRRTAFDHGIRYVSRRGGVARHEAVVYPSSLPTELWTDRAFTPRPCCFCDDTFAECADATFMDAWLAPYLSDFRGHSLVLVRRPEVADLLRRGAAQGFVWLRDVGIADVIQSQAGVVGSKRGRVRIWMDLACAAGEAVPRKREHLLARGRVPFWRKASASAVYRVLHESRLRWPESGKSPARYDALMAPWVKRAVRWRGICEALSRPWAVPLALLRTLRRRLGRVPKETGR
ncbi:MAG: Coenzyme F420 hydrogenase/dehydrogenase, beta subunit C-terminal domain [Planctomycetota bacterium]|nr:Coenzyme F420 hydrogenase/dehydrogenase, beta subunit C-terminal domain [Planctomycetota bacterium]